MPRGIKPPPAIQGMVKLDDCYDYVYRINKGDEFHRFMQANPVTVDRLDRMFITKEQFERFMNAHVKNN